MSEISITPANSAAIAGASIDCGTLGESVTAGHALYKKFRDGKLYKAHAAQLGALEFRTESVGRGNRSPDPSGRGNGEGCGSAEKQVVLNAAKLTRGSPMEGMFLDVPGTGKRIQIYKCGHCAIIDTPPV
jgi:hypothetical protein